MPDPSVATCLQALSVSELTCHPELNPQQAGTPKTPPSLGSLTSIELELIEFMPSLFWHTCGAVWKDCPPCIISLLRPLTFLACQKAQDAFSIRTWRLFVWSTVTCLPFHLV